jgi:hypothetical protein
MSTDPIEDHPDGEGRPQLRALPGGEIFAEGQDSPTRAAGVCGRDGTRRAQASHPRPLAHVGGGA